MEGNGLKITATCGIFNWDAGLIPCGNRDVLGRGAHLALADSASTSLSLSSLSAVLGGRVP